MNAPRLGPARREGISLAIHRFLPMFTRFPAHLGACFSVLYSLYWVSLLGNTLLYLRQPERKRSYFP